MSDTNREEYCGRIGGNVYMRTDKPCPECGAQDTHTPSSELRAQIEALKEDLRRAWGLHTEEESHRHKAEHVRDELKERIRLYEEDACERDGGSV